MAASYKDKGKDSFKTKLQMYLFELGIEGKVDSANSDGFNDYEISTDIVKIFTTQYWQHNDFQYKSKKIESEKLYNTIKQWEDNNAKDIKSWFDPYFKNKFREKFPKSFFNTLINKESCFYCGMNDKILKQLQENQQIFKKSFRGWSLEIDRINSNFEYSEINCVMACYWCNNAKTDEFTKCEFKEVGAVISGIWKARLKKNS